LQDPNDLEVVTGATAMFKCAAQGDPEPEIKWMINSNEIDSNDSRFNVLPDGTLKIDKTDMNHQGLWFLFLSLKEINF
jgi:peroxidase